MTDELDLDLPTEAPLSPARAAVGCERVDAYRAWVKADAAYYRSDRRGPKPMMPRLPDKTDYRAARERDR
jgi:hypothetical protein